MNDEIVVDGVPMGPTEVATFLTMLAALLSLIFHKDWGLGANAQTIAQDALILLPIALGILRSFKHHLATKVAIAKIGSAPALLPAVMGSSPGVVIYTNPPKADTPPTLAP